MNEKGVGSYWVQKENDLHVSLNHRYLKLYAEFIGLDQS